MKEALDKGEVVKVGLQTIKELHVSWLIKTHTKMEKKKQDIVSGLEQSGILNIAGTPVNFMFVHMYKS